MLLLLRLYSRAKETIFKTQRLKQKANKTKFQLNSKLKCLIGISLKSTNCIAHYSKV